jgi:hypothetical protein
MAFTPRGCGWHDSRDLSLQSRQMLHLERKDDVEGEEREEGAE